MNGVFHPGDPQVETEGLGLSPLSPVHPPPGDFPHFRHLPGFTNLRDQGAAEVRNGYPHRAPRNGSPGVTLDDLIGFVVVGCP